MDRNSSISRLAEEDYEAIADAVMETARGRWFLSEYAQRNRSADTEMLLEAINKMQDALGAQHMATGAPGGEIRLGIMDMASAIAQTRREIAAMVPEDADEGGIVAATEELDAIVQSTEKATTTILEAAEKVQETAWHLREAGADDTHCDTLDDQATEIYTACSFQDITGQRTGKIVEVLRFLEQRLSSMLGIWDAGKDVVSSSTGAPNAHRHTDAHLLNGPQLEGNGADQGDIDLMLSDDDFGVSHAPSHEPATDPADAGDEPEKPRLTTSPVTAQPTDEAPEKTDPADAAPPPAQTTPAMTSPDAGVELAQLDKVDRSALFS